MSVDDSMPSESSRDRSASRGMSMPRELIDALPADKRQELLDRFEQQIVHIRSEEHYSGPDIHPEIAARWEDILPGSAKELFELSHEREIQRMARQDRILAIAEELTRHRIKTESKDQSASAVRDQSIVRAIANRERRGQWFAFLTAMGITLGGFVMIHLGHDAAGIALLIAEVAGIAGIFCYQLWSAHRRAALADSYQKPVDSAT